MAARPPSFSYDGFSRFPTFFFGASATGLQNQTQLELMSRFSLVGWGWEQGTGPFCHNSWSHQADYRADHYLNEETRYWMPRLPDHYCMPRLPDRHCMPCLPGRHCMPCLHGRHCQPCMPRLQRAMRSCRLVESATRFRSYLEWGAGASATAGVDARTKPVFVYRNFAMALHFYDLQRAAYS
jgi:hypothetical protein